MKFTLKKIAMGGLAIGLSGLMLINTTGCSYNPKYMNNNQTTSQTTTITSDYINTLKTDELRVYDEDRNTITINLSDYNYINFLNQINSDDYSFEYAQYYGLDEALALYNSTNVSKSTSSTLLDASGKIDANKLMQKIIENNTKYMSQDKYLINPFYSEMGTSDMTMICKTIADIVNKDCSQTDIAKVANTLMDLTMFLRTGSASNAYITNDLTFVYNPTMSGLYADMQEMQGSTASEEETLNQVITHEVYHLIQYAASDTNDLNGIEAGIFRMFNVPNKDAKLKVDSLWNTWLLEAAAELQMADYLNIEPGTYTKRISYARSYNLSRFNELNLDTQKLEDVAFNHTLEEAYKNLNLNTVEEQREFLNFLYSVEIIQIDPPEFWTNYTNKTGITPTEDEKIAIRMDIRTEIVKYMSKTFYNNLANAIHEGKVTDMDSAFYLIRNWELDAYGHLEYTKTASLEHATDFIIWQEEAQKGLFSALAESNGLTTEEVKTQYIEYNLQANVGNQIYDNCNFSNYNTATSTYITSAKNNYTTRNFSKNSDVYEYILEQSATDTKTTENYTK